MELLHLLEKIHPAHAGQIDIEDQDAKDLLAQQRQSFLGVAGLGDFTDVRLFRQYLFQPPAYDGMIVGDQDVDHRSSALETSGQAGFGDASSGTATETVVPRPGTFVISRAPPISVALSRIPSSPN